MTTKTPITERWLISKKFVRRTERMYVLTLKLPFSGSWEIIANTAPNDKWMAYYWVNNTAGSNVKNYQEEVEELYRAVTGKEL